MACSHDVICFSGLPAVLRDLQMLGSCSPVFSHPLYKLSKALGMCAQTFVCVCVHVGLQVIFIQMQSHFSLR